MAMVAKLLALLVAAEHIGILVLEMFFWQTPTGMKAFGTTPQTAATTATLAANQGLYNGFLAAGLIWGVVAGKRDVTIFFLLCVIVAGIFGALTAKPSIFFVQAVPALLALAATWFSSRS